MNFIIGKKSESYFHYIPWSDCRRVVARAMSYSVANGAKLFVNEGTDYISLSGTPQVNTSTVAFNIGQYFNESLTGYVSNLRILNGTALYTSDFTPTHELEVIGDTVLLCCNNSDSAGADGTGKTITANANAAASTFSPGSETTSGTEFRVSQH